MRNTRGILLGLVLLILLTATLTIAISPQLVRTNAGAAFNGASSSTMTSNSLILLGSGARWASPNGSSALYVDFYDNLVAHPNPTVFPCYEPGFFLPQRRAITAALEGQGFNVTYSGDVPSDLNSYNLVVIDAYWACNPSIAPQIETFISGGGGVVLLWGTPCYLSSYSTEWSAGTNLNPIQAWFGASMYYNSIGTAHVIVDNPAGSSLESGDLLGTWNNGSFAAVNGLSNDSTVLATWDDGNVLSFTHSYGYGRIYYQSEYRQSPVADFGSVQISPDNPTSENQVNVTVTFENTEVDMTVLLCNGVTYTMTKNVDGTFNVTLPPAVQGGQIQFQLSASDVNGNWVSSNVYSYSVGAPNSAPGEAGQVYFSLEPVAVAPLVDINVSANGLETPPIPSPVGENFTVEIHLRNATATNVPDGVAGVEVHFNFANILDYCKPIGFADELGQPGGALVGPVNYALKGFYDDKGNPIVNPPYTNATQYMVAAATTTGPWYGNDGIVALITFQITRQPPQNTSQPYFYAQLQIGFGELIDSNFNDIPFSVAQGTLRIDDPWSLTGDLNRDGKVDLQDLVLMANAYGSKPGDPKWNSNADIAPPYGIIGLSDLVTLSLQYGQHSP